MPIFYSDMQKAGEFTLPNLFSVSGYKVYFWSNENDEPIHVHVSKGKPSPKATKIFLSFKYPILFGIIQIFIIYSFFNDPILNILNIHI